MKIIGLIILVFLLALLQTTTKAQTASNQPVSKYYSPLLKEKLEAGVHPAPANPSTALPSENDVPQKAKDLGLETCVFDRGVYLYHGRVKAIADGAREGGLKF